LAVSGTVFVLLHFDCSCNLPT